MTDQDRAILDTEYRVRTIRDEYVGGAMCGLDGRLIGIRRTLRVIAPMLLHRNH